MADVERLKDESPVSEQDLASVIDAIPEDKKPQALRVLSAIKREYFSGPIPPPDVFRKYEETLPGSADRILKMAEAQQTHRIGLENQAISEQLVSNKRGQIFGFIICIVILCVSMLFAYCGMKVFSGVLATVTIVFIVGLFINGKVLIDKDLRKKVEKTKEEHN